MMTSSMEALTSGCPMLDEFLLKPKLLQAKQECLRAIETLEPGGALVYHVGYLYGERTQLDGEIRVAVHRLLRDRPQEFESVQRRIDPRLPVLSVDGRKRPVDRGFVYILRYLDRSPPKPQARRL